MVSLSNHDTVERSSFDKLRMSGKVRMSGVMLAFLCLFALATRVRLQPETAVQALGLPPGWNLIADPGGIVTSGPAYTYQIGDAGYETVPAGTPLVPGLGYWVLATSRSAVPLGAGSPAATILAPAGQVVMVGNPSGILPAAVHGADMLITYDPVNGYHQVTNGILTPGQGAFALSVAGGQIQLDAQGTTAAICSTAETGSACPVGGACPQGYPVAITQDGAAHPAPGPGDPALQVTPVLCFNAFSQALGAGYQAAARTRLRLDGPVSVTTSDMRFTVLSAMLESPDAFMARVLASGDQLCAGCNVAGATAVVTLQYGVENLQRPPTMFSAGQFVSAHDPRELSPAYFLLQSQHAIDPAHDGVPVAGTISGVFAFSKLADIGEVDWRLDNPLLDVSSGIPQPHGPSVLFALNFRGPQAGQIVAYGGGSAPLPPYDPCQCTLGAAAAPAAATTPLPAGAQAAATLTPAAAAPSGAPTTGTAPAQATVAPGTPSAGAAPGGAGSSATFTR